MLIKTLLAAETAAFDPQVVRIITVAFEEAWELLTQADLHACQTAARGDARTARQADH